MPKAPKSPSDPSPFAAHDHGHCRAGLLAKAEALAAAQGARVTPVRRRTLEILAESHQALGAYDVLERLAAEGFGHQPPVAYRALEFWEGLGLAHKIRRLNAFIACAHPGPAHAPAFLICERCQAVAEAPAGPILAALKKAAAPLGFVIAHSHLEATGLCPACREAA